MITKLFSLYDVKSGIFSHPFHAVNDQVAIRSVVDLCREKNQISNNPSDFALHQVGEFDDNLGLFIARPTTNLIGIVANLIRE